MLIALSDTLGMGIIGVIMVLATGLMTWFGKRQDYARLDKVAALLKETNREAKEEAQAASKERLTNGVMLKKVIKNTDGALTAALSAVIFEGEDSLMQMEERAKVTPSKELTQRIDAKKKHLEQLKRDFKEREESMKLEEEAGLTRMVVEGKAITHDTEVAGAVEGEAVTGGESAE